MPIITTPGYPGASSIANGGKIYVFNSLTTLVTVAPANPSRQSITFHNPGPIDILVGPTLAYATIGASAPTTLTPTTANYGGCFRVFSNGGQLTITGECQGNWQALTTDGSAGKLTVMDSNV